MAKEDMVHMYEMEYYLVIKNNEILPFAATWMDLEIIILSDISQTEKDKYHIFFTCMWNLKKKRYKRYKGTYLWKRNRPTDIENKFIVTKGERIKGVDKLGV